METSHPLANRTHWDALRSLLSACDQAISALEGATDPEYGEHAIAIEELTTHRGHVSKLYWPDIHTIDNIKIALPSVNVYVDSPDGPKVYRCRIKPSGRKPNAKGLRAVIHVPVTHRRPYNVSVDWAIIQRHLADGIPIRLH